MSENYFLLFRREYDPYSYHDDLYIEEEPIYVPRSVMADIIYKNEDDLLSRRHKAKFPTDGLSIR